MLNKIRNYLRMNPRISGILYKAFIVTVFLAVTIFMAWGIQTKAEKKREAIRQQELAEERDRIWAEDQARVAALEAQKAADEAARKAAIEEDVVLMAKLLAGIDGFVENYGYSESDLRTYGECVINRVIDKKNGFPNTIREVILQENQWVGFSESNQVISKYYQIASVIVHSYYNDEMRPCSSVYCWVDMNRKGCWLMNEYSDSPYVNRWRYSA